MFRSKCDNCGEHPYIFPDQIQKIKQNDNLKLFPYVKDKLKVGSAWFCIKCDSGNQNGKNCKIVQELPAELAEKMIKIRKRETNLKSMGFVLPSLT